MLRLDADHAHPFIDEHRFAELRTLAVDAQDCLINGSGAGSEYTGWRNLLADPDFDLVADVTETAREIRERADILLCIGIGGSYLGAKAVIQALSPYFPQDGPEILFAGHHMSGAYLRELLDRIRGRSVYVNVISKSGTTLEPALAFRFVRRFVEDAFDDADRRIIVTTDPERGALNALHREHGYRKYTIPPGVGGRFSVLTPVGMLPIATAGIDTAELLRGATAAFTQLSSHRDNLALDYAAIRCAMLRSGKTIDLMSIFEPRLLGMAQWWQQLFGESEGKDGTGLFPAVAQYSTDLHSIGQFVQEGSRTLMETFLMIEDDEGDLIAPSIDGDVDGLNYLAGKTLSEVNRAAYQGTAAAHADGGVPNITLWLDRLSPETIGEAIYFFEHAVAVSGYLIGVNPFDQPGVEAYKKAMFQLLGRP